MNKTSEFHGWSDGRGTSLHIGRLPGRKRPSLYECCSTEFCASIYPLASFRDEEAASRAMALLDKLLGV